jgi:peptidoglycan/xylan/chitin deacetylase (PgdA/CDA1 family)
MNPKNPSITLMYHAVVEQDSDTPPNREDGAELYDLNIKAFGEQMDYLYQHGLNTRVVITFDDGERNNFTQAFPVLQKFGFSAHFFVIVNRIGTSGYMNWSDLKVMIEGGMIIGSHGLTHRILTELTDEEIRKELVESKRILEENLHTKIDSFSIPRGYSSNAILDSAYTNGYKYVFVSKKEKNVTQPCIERVAVKSDWTLERFQLALQGEVPFSEKIQTSLKDATKAILGSEKYNKMRSTLLKRKTS